jgi:hypothetical protein
MREDRKLEELFGEDDPGKIRVRPKDAGANDDPGQIHVKPQPEFFPPSESPAR